MSWARDSYEAVVGLDLITGKKLDTFSRSMAVLGVATGGVGSKIGKSFKMLKRLMKSEKAAEAIQNGEKVVEVAESLTLINPELGRKLDYLLGKATGSIHNLERSQDMLKQMERIGLPDSQKTRFYIANHFKKTINDPSSVLKTQENG